MIDFDLADSFAAHYNQLVDVCNNDANCIVYEPIKFKGKKRSSYTHLMEYLVIHYDLSDSPLDFFTSNSDRVYSVKNWTIVGFNSEYSMFIAMEKKTGQISLLNDDDYSISEFGYCAKDEISFIKGLIVLIKYEIMSLKIGHNNISLEERRKFYDELISTVGGYNYSQIYKLYFVELF